MDDLKLYESSKSELKVLVNQAHAYSKEICHQDDKRVSGEGVKLPSGETMKDVAEEGYKYLGVVQNENVINRKMKDKVRNEYFRRVKLIAKSKLSKL